VAIIRIARLWPGAERITASSARVVNEDPLVDSLDAFGSEAVASFPRPAKAAAVVDLAGHSAPIDERPATATAVNWTKVRTALKWVGVVVLSGTTAVAGAWEYQRRAAASGTGSLTIQTTPAGLEVGINGRPAGVTPLTLALAPASYAVQVGNGAQRRELTVVVNAGSAVLQHLELPASIEPAPVATTGSLRVQTDPAGQTVSIAGVERGQSPLTIEALPAGDHAVVVRGAKGSVRRTVTVKAGETVSLVISPVVPVAPAAGWLSVQASTRLELRQFGKLIGTTETEQIMLPAGEHDIEIANESIGYRTTRQVEVVSGKVTTLGVELPFGTISINALPWAEVWIDGERIGDTPIANLSRRIGTHEVVFKHPQLGERRETVLLTLRQPVRFGVDMRGKQ
jgi:PEGA domain